MATFTEDIISNRSGMGGFGADGGGGVLMGILLASILRGNGLGGDNDTASADLSNITQTLGDIKAAVPLAEAQTQLALQSMTQYLSQGQTNQILALAQTGAALARDIANVDTNVDRQSTAIQSAINSDGEKTRALITTNLIAELNQRLTVAQQEALELRSESRRAEDRHGIEITMTNNQNQMQQQQQQQGWLLNQLVAGLGQVAKATNSSVVVGSSGVGTKQNANPTNVSA